MRDVFERTEELRNEFLADAAALTDQMNGGTPLADLHAARRQLIEQLADIDARITQREPLERAHADALRMADALAREITAGRRLNAPVPAADAHRAGGMPPADLREIGQPVAGHATTDTATDRPFRGQTPPPTPEALESGAPLTTCTDLPEPDTDGPRHAAPRDRTGPLAILTGLGRTEKNGGQADA